jgi:ribA/ribD-fused uncharacterized protein
MMIRDVESLLASLQSGTAPKYLFFWGHTPRREGVVDASCFSQWFPADFEIDGQTYPTAEHWMMAEKARLFADHATRERILSSSHPKQAKSLGRQIRGFDEEVWTAERFGIVVRGNVAKFDQNEQLRAFLLNTNKRVLVEASPVDRIWGIGLASDDARASQPDQWRGLNLLGFALIDVRDQLAP